MLLHSNRKIDNNLDWFKTADMKQKTSWLIMFAGFSLLLFASASCKKASPSDANIVAPSKPSSSPEELKQRRYEWNLQTLVEPYKMAGHTDSKWDSFATSALTEFARVRANVCDENEPTGIIIATNASAAVDAGCDDPLVNYLFIRFAFP